MRYIVASVSIVYSVLFLLFWLFIPNNQGGAVQASQATPQATSPEKVFQILANEIIKYIDRGDTQFIWIKNNVSGECFQLTRTNLGVAQSPALCEKKK